MNKFEVSRTERFLGALFGVASGDSLGGLTQS